MNSAPALIAISACPAVNTVPAPRRISGKRERIRAMASAAAAVRNVISAQPHTPSSSASASGKASSSFGRLMTGTIPIPRARSTMLIEDPLWKISVMNRAYITDQSYKSYGSYKSHKSYSSRHVAVQALIRPRQDEAPHKHLFLFE